MASTQNMNKKRWFVADGVFYAELNELFKRELAGETYSGVDVRRTPMEMQIIIRASNTTAVIGNQGRRIRELTAAVQKRFGFADGAVEVFADRVQNKALCAQSQAESLKSKLIEGHPVRRACYSVLRYVMENEAMGCEVIVSGKLRAQRAKSMKFKEGFMIKSGQPSQDYVTTGVRHVLMRQGVLGVKVKIMLPNDPTGRLGPKHALADYVKIIEPKEAIVA